ncbi:MAG: helix-turn-helix domain-containing protein [Nitrososphaerales archaeon]
MARASLEDRIRAVLLYIEGAKDAKEISSVLGVSLRTIWRWIRSYRAGGPEALARKKPGPESGTNSIPEALEERIVYLKQKHLSWGARRINYQYDLSCHWRTVHGVIKRHHMLVRIKAKPQPSKRFQRKHVDSMWQGDSFQFRISSVGKVYVTGFTDDRSRFNIMLVRQFNYGAPNKGLMIVDQAHEDQYRKLVAGFQTKGSKYGLLTHIVDIPYFATRKDTRMLQLADFCGVSNN